jgi:poly(3-hydroxybutyrate) depolymerase
MIALHGSGDTATNFMSVWKNIAESEGFIVLVPESVNGGASWNLGYDPPVISALYDRVLADYNVDECRVYLTGYSAGAHVTYELGLYNADVFAGLGVQAGSMQFAVQDGVWPDDTPRQIPVSIHHGQNDQVVPISHAQYAKSELEGAGHVVYYDTHAGGHEIGAGDPLEMWTNLSDHSLDD